MIPCSRKTILGALALVAWCFALYGPGLNRVFVSDHIWYMAELEHAETLADRLRLYDYQLSRQYFRGDELLFRPLLLVWMGVEHYLFGPNHVAWNVANLFVHAVTALCLWGLLRQIQPSRVSWLFSAVFAAMTPQGELVLWNHLGGYIWGYAFFLLGMTAYVRIVRQGSSASSWSPAAYGVCMSISALFYEVMLVPAAAMGTHLAWHLWRNREAVGAARRRIGLAAVSPILVFALLYIPHLLRAPRLFYVDAPGGSDVASNALSLDPLRYGKQALSHWIQETLLPTGLFYGVTPFGRMWREIHRWWNQPLYLANLALVGLSLFALARSVSLQDLKERGLFLLAVGASVVGYVLIIATGRGDLKGNCYYLYFFCLSLTILVYSLADSEGRRPGARRWATLILAGWGLLYGFETWKFSRTVHVANQSAHQYLSSLDRFVRDHRKESGFTFAIDNPPLPGLDPEIALMKGYPDDAGAPLERRRLSAILYARTYRAENPRYRLRWDGREFRASELGPTQP